MLQHSRIVFIGLGGIGSVLSLFLSQFLYSLKRECTMYLVDGDHYEPRNEERMLFSRVANKAEVKSEELSKQFGDFIHYRPIPNEVTRENIAGTVQEGDVAFLCVDNHVTRLLTSQHCETLENILLISGGNDGVEDGKDGTFGNVQIYFRSENTDVTNSLTKFHPEIKDPAPRKTDETGCGALIQGAAPQLLATNLAVASAMLNTFYSCLLEELRYEELYLNIIAGTMVPVRRKVE